MSDDSELLEYYPATEDAFARKAGDVKAVKRSDLEDANRRRHLESFRESMNAWMTYGDRRSAVDGFTGEELDTFTLSLVQKRPQNDQQLAKIMQQLRRDLKINPSKSQLIASYWKLLHEGEGEPCEALENLLIRKAVRTNSGVLVITVLTSPGAFSCPKDCHYCPNEPGQPRSYLSTEPAVLRANQNRWDAAEQFWDRALTLLRNGHVIDKIEVLVLGGTWSGYPVQYQEEFIRDLFYAANTFQEVIDLYRCPPDFNPSKDAAFVPENRPGKLASSVESTDKAGSRTLRGRSTLEEEQEINETATSKIIGLTLETRPDYITRKEIRRLRRYGCTRVQIGIQHTDEAVLQTVNRGCSLPQCIKAMRLLKDACFKVDIHLMPDLPGSNVALDRQMFTWTLSSPELQADQWKIYPCEVTPFSKIEEWYKEGSFLPYAEEDPDKLLRLLIAVKVAVHPWIRLNRVIRDIPNQSIIAGNKMTNLRQVLMEHMGRLGLQCRCIRCREVRQKDLDPLKDATLKIRQYQSSGGVEFFVSFETEDEKVIFGFLRLRILNPREAEQKYSTFSELTAGVGLIRELHVYGSLVAAPPVPSNVDKFVRSENHEEIGRYQPGTAIEASEATTSGLAPPLPEEGSQDGFCSAVETPAFHTPPETESPPSEPTPLPEEMVRSLHKNNAAQAGCSEEEEGTVHQMKSLQGYPDGVVEDSVVQNVSQHVGLGTRLLVAAEVLALANGQRRLAVIAGIGTREYYRKFGYEVEGSGGYMLKTLVPEMTFKRAQDMFETGAMTVQVVDLRTKLCLVPGTLQEVLGEAPKPLSKRTARMKRKQNKDIQRSSKETGDIANAVSEREVCIQTTTVAPIISHKTATYEVPLSTCYSSLSPADRYSAKAIEERGLPCLCQEGALTNAEAVQQLEQQDPEEEALWNSKSDSMVKQIGSETTADVQGSKDASTALEVSSELYQSPSESNSLGCESLPQVELSSTIVVSNVRNLHQQEINEGASIPSNAENDAELVPTVVAAKVAATRMSWSCNVMEATNQMHLNTTAGLVDESGVEHSSHRLELLGNKDASSGVQTSSSVVLSGASISSSSNNEPAEPNEVSCERGDSSKKHTKTGSCGSYGLSVVEGLSAPIQEAPQELKVIAGVVSTAVLVLGLAYFMHRRCKG